MNARTRSTARVSRLTRKEGGAHEGRAQAHTPSPLILAAPSPARMRVGARQENTRGRGPDLPAAIAREAAGVLHGATFCPACRGRKDPRAARCHECAVAARRPTESGLRGRILANVRLADSGCWEWAGTRTTYGYGTLTAKNYKPGRRTLLAHRPGRNGCRICRHAAQRVRRAAAVAVVAPRPTADPDAGFWPA
jgi:hypothetical protein